MNTRRLPEHGMGSLWRVLAFCCLAASAYGQQAPGYRYPPPPGYGQPQYQSPAPTYPQQGYPRQGYAQPEYQTEYVSPLQFLPTFGRKFGDMFRRVFYGDPPPPTGYQMPQGYPQHGRSLDSAPPSYQSHYGQPPQGYPQQPGYQQPRYQQPPPQQVPQYQVPPPPSQTPASPQSSRMGTTPPPRMSVKPKTTESTPPKKYVPPTITKKNSSTVEEAPPPSSDRKEKSSGNTEYYPLPGVQPKKEETTASTSKPKTSSSGNTGSFLKGKKASKEGRVISPYPPYQELDVTGLSSGSLALDPTTQKVFEVP